VSLSPDEFNTFDRLSQILTVSRGETHVLNDYYENIHRLHQLGLAIPPELRIFSVPIAWPRVTVDGVEQRLDVTGFRLPGQSADSYLWENWQYNNMDERQTFAHTDSLALARSYVCVGTNPDDPDQPIVTVESPLEMFAARDPRTHHVTAALRLYGTLATGVAAGQSARATLYMPNVTRWLINDEGNLGRRGRSGRPQLGCPACGGVREPEPAYPEDGGDR
jgi:hypothetical protein